MTRINKMFKIDYNYFLLDKYVIMINIQSFVTLSMQKMADKLIIEYKCLYRVVNMWLFLKQLD